MANTVTIKETFNGTQRIIFTVDVIGDGSGDETNTVIYDWSADTLAGAATSISLETINASTDAVSIRLSFDGSTDMYCWEQGNNTVSINQDFSKFGGIKNSATAPTGDLLLSTNGLGTGEHFFLIITLRKN